MYIRLTLPNGNFINLDIVRDTYRYTEVLYNDLKPVDNTVKCSVPFTVEFSNAIQSFINDDIKAVLIDDESQTIFTGYLRKSATLSKATRNGVIGIELVPPTYILNREYGDNKAYINVKLKAVIEHLIGKANLSAAVIDCPDITLPLVQFDEKTNIQNTITQLLFEFGYVYTFTATGDFKCVKLFGTMPAVIEQKFSDANTDGTANMYGVYSQSVKERQFYSVSAEFKEIEYKENQTIFLDQSGKEVEPGAYLFGNENGEYLTYDCDGVQAVEYIDSAALSVTASGSYVHEFTNFNKKALLKLQNNTAQKINVSEIKVTGSGYFVTATSTTKVTEGLKQKDIKLSYVFAKSAVESLVRDINNYYRYSAKTLQLRSKDDYPIGSYATVTAEGSGTYTARVIKKTYSLVSDMIDYELESVTDFTPAEVTTQGVHGSISFPITTIGTPIPALRLSKVLFNGNDTVNVRCVISDGSVDKDYPAIIKITDSDGVKIYESDTAEVSHTLNAVSGKDYTVEMLSSDGIKHDYQSVKSAVNGAVFNLSNEYQRFESGGVGFTTTVKGKYNGSDVPVWITSVDSPSTFNNQVNNDSVMLVPTGDVITDGSMTIHTTMESEPPAVFGFVSGGNHFVFGFGNFVLGAKHEDFAALDFKYGNFDVSMFRPTLDQRIDEVVSSIESGSIPVYTGVYLGAFTSVTAVPESGNWNDFFLWSGEDTETLSRGELYYWNGTGWAVDTDTEHLTVAMTDMLGILDMLPAEAMARLFVSRLVASTVFTDALFAKLITLKNPGLIKSDNYSETEKTGFQIGSDGKAVFNDTVIRGEVNATSGTFNGEVKATSGTFNNGTFTNCTMTGSLTLQSGKALKFNSGSSITNINVNGTTMELTIS